VDFAHDEDCPLILINADGLTQVFLNLFRNAIESMENSGVLSVQTSYDTEQGVIQIRIQDTGRGISPQHASRLFDPFYTTKQKGTGLGLSISQQIVEEHDGTIEVDVTQPQGTAFVITLPA
jgi:two-component system sensor histidine kinase HydH